MLLANTNGAKNFQVTELEPHSSEKLQVSGVEITTSDLPSLSRLFVSRVLLL